MGYPDPATHAARLARPRAVIRVDGAGRDRFTHRRVALTGSGFCLLSRCLIGQQCASASVFLRNLLRGRTNGPDGRHHMPPLSLQCDDFAACVCLDASDLDVRPSEFWS